MWVAASAQIVTLLKDAVPLPEQGQQGLSQGPPSAETSRGLLQAPCASRLPLLLALQLDNKII